MLLLLYNSLYTRACGKGRKGKGKINILKASLKVLPVVLPITREGAKGEIFFFSIVYYPLSMTGSCMISYY